MVIQLPVRGDLPQFEFRIQLDQVIYTLKYRWNDRMSRWVMDIANEQGENIVAGIVLGTNRDLTSRYKTYAIPQGFFIVYDETGNQLNPNRSNFGKEVKMFYDEVI